MELTNLLPKSSVLSTGLSRLPEARCREAWSTRQDRPTRQLWKTAPASAPCHPSPPPTRTRRREIFLG